MGQRKRSIKTLLKTSVCAVLACKRVSYVRSKRLCHEKERKPLDVGFPLYVMSCHYVISADLPWTDLHFARSSDCLAVL